MDDRQTISYEALDPLIDDIQNFIDRCECDLIYEHTVAKRPHLRATASLRDATHRCVERAAPREALARVPRLILTLART